MAQTLTIPTAEYTPSKGDRLEMPWGYERDIVALVEVVQDGYHVYNDADYLLVKVIDPMNWPEELPVGEEITMLVSDGPDCRQMEEVHLVQGA